MAQELQVTAAELEAVKGIIIIVGVVISILMTIIGFFLKHIYTDFKNTKEITIRNQIQIEAAEKLNESKIIHVMEMNQKETEMVKNETSSVKEGVTSLNNKFDQFFRMILVKLETDKKTA